MDDLLGIGFILLVVVGYFLFSFIALIILLGRTNDMKVKLDLMQKKLLDLSKGGIKSTEITGSNPATMEAYKQAMQKPVSPSVTTPPSAPSAPIAEPVLRSAPPEVPKPEAPKPQFMEDMIKPVTAAAASPQARPVTPPRPPEPPKPKKPGFWESNPDLEKFIGENLINKIAILLVVLGVGYFVKVAIDQNWINEYGRVAIGILCGGILIGTAHYLRNSYRGFSSVLVGGGIAIFYFTITLAFQVYGMFHPPVIAFSIMVVITIFTVILSLAYDRKELAVLAIIGGFGAPLMVSTGQGNYIVLFTYIAILNIGMLILAYFKRWNIINVVAFLFTVLLYSGWIGDTITKGKPLPYLGALIFATAFYLIFFLMNIINNLKNNKQFVAFEFSLLLGNTVAYYSAGMFILKSLNEGLYQGLFTILLALFNFVFAFTLFRSKKVDSNVIYLLIGLVMTFVSLAAPIQLKGNYITLFWAAEAVLLLWLSQKSGIKLMKLGSLLINLLMMVSLVMDWNNVYALSTEPQDIILNKAFLTTLTVIASLFLTVRLLKAEDQQLSIGVDKVMYQSFLAIALGLIIYVGGVAEITYQMSRFVDEHLYDVLVVDVLLYTATFTVGLQVLLLLLKKEKGLLFPVGLSIILMLLYMFIGASCIDSISMNRFEASTLLPAKHFMMNYPLALMFGVMLVLNIHLLKRKDPSGQLFNRYLWVFCGSILFIFSLELENFIVWTQTNSYEEAFNAQHQVYKIGFPILWGISAFAAMIVGMIKKIRGLRIISLVIFGITLLKVALFDFMSMSAGGKIATPIVLGLLLLIISFLYQRAEKLSKEEEAKSKNNINE